MFVPLTEKHCRILKAVSHSYTHMHSGKKPNKQTKNHCILSRWKQMIYTFKQNADNFCTMFAQTLTIRGWSACWALAVFFCIALRLRLVWIVGAFKALCGRDCLVRHTLPHYVTFPPQSDLLQQYNTKDTQVIRYKWKCQWSFLTSTQISSNRIRLF